MAEVVKTSSAANHGECRKHTGRSLAARVAWAANAETAGKKVLQKGRPS